MWVWPCHRCSSYLISLNQILILGWHTGACVIDVKGNVLPRERLSWLWGFSWRKSLADMSCKISDTWSRQTHHAVGKSNERNQMYTIFTWHRESFRLYTVFRCLLSFKSSCNAVAARQSTCIMTKKDELEALLGTWSSGFSPCIKIFILYLFKDKRLFLNCSTQIKWSQRTVIRLTSWLWLNCAIQVYVMGNRLRKFTLKDSIVTNHSSISLGQM